MKRFEIVLPLLVLPATACFAQSSPNLSYGQVPSAAQWNSFFASKQDVLGFVPVNKAGDVMQGPLGVAPSTQASTGFNLGVGIAPTNPQNGDMWLTTSGLFVQFNNQTVSVGLNVPNTNGLLKSTNGVVGPAVAGTDYLVPTGSAGGLLYTQPAGIAQSINQVLANYHFASADGVVCDGSTNTTAALQTSMNNALAANQWDILPPGTCMVDALLYNTIGSSNQIRLRGNNTTLQKATADGASLLTIGSATATSYTVSPRIENITLSGITGNTPNDLVMYNTVRGKFPNVVAQNALTGVNVYAGNTNDFPDLTVQNDVIGFHAQTLPNGNVAGATVPNLISLPRFRAYNNSTFACDFEGGNNFSVSDYDIETNGTASNTSTGACYIAAVPTGAGAHFVNGWFEQNAGNANLWLNGGNNVIDNPHFTNTPLVNYDVLAAVGTYTLRDPVFSGIRTSGTYLKETTTSAGNNIIDPVLEVPSGFNSAPYDLALAVNKANTRLSSATEFSMPPTAMGVTAAATGSVTLPGGIIINWGQCTTSGTAPGSCAVTYAKPFPNAYLNIEASAFNGSGVAQTSATPAGGGPANALAGATLYSNPTNVTVSYIAIGD